MPVVDFLKSSPVIRSPRVLQLEGLFEIPPSQKSEIQWHVDLPIESRDWNIGLIVGPSGCGKSSIAREMFGPHLVESFDWPNDRSVVDAFPSDMSIKEISALLSSVGFSSPPSWLRPFGVLSTGERFRVTVARALSEMKHLTVIDEFTSVVDRTVAQIGAAAVAKAVRKRKQKLIAVSCHSDIIDWLQPDWIYQPHLKEFQWRELQRRPSIELEIARVHSSAWGLFKLHHYLNTSLNNSARCFCAFIKDAPVAFASVLSFPHPSVPGWREHRTVCLPDYQGIGIGNALSEFVASLYRATGKPYRSTTSNPAMVSYRARSPRWKALSLNTRHSAGCQTSILSLRRTYSTTRLVSSFEYVGESRPDEARAFGLVA